MISKNASFFVLMTLTSVLLTACGQATEFNSNADSDKKSQSSETLTTPHASATYVGVSSCAGLNALLVIPGSNGLSVGSTFSCQHCASYFDSATPSIDSGGFTSCVRSLNSGNASVSEIVAYGKDWSIQYACTPAAESDCDTHGSNFIELAYGYGILTNFGNGPYDPNHLPSGLSLVAH